MGGLNPGGLVGWEKWEPWVHPFGGQFLLEVFLKRPRVGLPRAKNWGGDGHKSRGCLKRGLSLGRVEEPLRVGGNHVWG